jgi:two-component system phosphate regulon response regulator PhoB
MTRHVLIVDDERPARTLLEHALSPLEDLEVELHTAEDASRAILLSQTHPIDLALIDVHMPGVTGIELCENLRACPNAAGAFIILMGELGQELTAAELSSLRADGFALRPFDPEELLERVSTVLGIKLEE